MATSLSRYARPSPARVEQRAAPRHALSVSRATMRRHGVPAIPATLEDLSLYGCRLSAVMVAEEGERLWLRFAGGLPVAATVVWSDGGKVGCRFDQPLDRDLLRTLTLN